MANPVLIVPVQLDALVVNQNLLNRDGDLRSWQFNYKALTNYSSPQPPAFGNQTGTTAPGVFLHWNLPRALRKGKQDRASGKIVYPLVPNRWLIVRVHGKNERHCKAWVIESDCPLTDGVKEKLPEFSVEQTSLYAVEPSVVRAWKASPDKLRNTIKLDANANGPKVANIGVTFPLEKGWNERTSKTSFLTSVAPGNAAFSIYYAQNVGVLSMYDDLAGVDKDTVSYFVSGWYSDAGDDILASWQNDKTSADPYGALLQELGWIMQGSSADKPVQSFYEGVALSINWDRNGAPPENDPLKDVRDNSKLNVSLGNTTIDSFSALIGKQLEISGKPAQNAKLLRAFQYDLLPLLNKVHGDVLLENRIRQEWFSPEQGATKWMIAGKGAKDDDAVEISPEEIVWLTQLNIEQQNFEAGIQELTDLQWQLHAAWWKLGRNPEKFPNTKITSQQLRDFINPSNQKGITTRVIQQASKLSTLKSAVPSPKWENNKKPEDAFADGITAFAKERKLGDNKLLKAANGPRYWKAANPVLTISGLEPSSAADPDEVLKVRSSANLITGLSCADKKITGDTLSKAIPLPAGSNTLPEICLRLLSEFFLIDPSNAAALAKASGIPEAQLTGTMQKHDAQAYSGILPSNDLQPWSQAWEPVFVEWQVNYKHIPFSTGDKTNWDFNGNDYSYSAQNNFPKNKGRSIGGISLLGSHPQTLFRKRLKEYLQKYKNASLDEINAWITSTDGWKFIAQELTGFHELLAYRDVRLFRRPGSNDAIGDEKIPLAALTGFPTEASATNVYQPVRVRNVPYLPNGETTDFHGIRHGQVYFEGLVVYDKFGRQLWVIESGDSTGLYDSKNFPLIRDAAFIPQHPLDNTIAGVAELPPRLLQPAQLDFSLVNAVNDEPLPALTPKNSPVGGWIIPNHLDRSLLLYSPAGESLGEFRLFVQTGGMRKGSWSPPPGGTINTVEELNERAPLIYDLVNDPALSDERAFQSFLQVIDETLWTIDPLGERDDRNLSVLIGRPLALIRARLQLKLSGPPLRDCSWETTLNPPAPEFPGFEFDVRLGDQLTREDGLIGYFSKNNYSVFNSVVQPEIKNQEYVHPIQPGNFLQLKFNNESFEFVTMLADPRTGIHATTGILPIKQLEIPSLFTGDALRNIELSFRTGPVLSAVVASPAQGDKQPEHENSIFFPLPAEKNGTWSWWEKTSDGKTTEGFGVTAAFPNTSIKSIPNTLREGWLRLHADIGESPKSKFSIIEIIPQGTGSIDEENNKVH